MKRKESILISTLFILLLVIPLALTLILPKKDFSEWENRNLEPFPKVSGETVFSGDFGKSFELWLTDHFMARDFFVRLKRGTDAAMFIRESNGIIIGNNGLFDIPETPNEETVSKNVSAINTFREKYSLPTSLVLVPSASEIFPDELPLDAPKTQESSVIDGVYSRVEGVKTIDAIGAIRKLSYTDAFYKTDHHWTSKGAAEVYKAWLGEERDFEFKTVSDSFFGTLTSRSGDVSVLSDKIEKIVSGEKFTLTAGEETKDSMYYDEYLDKKDKYSYFMGTNKGIVTLEGDAGTGKVLLLFKDSYAHTFVQCAAEDFDKVILVDLRYVPAAPLSTLIDLSEVTDVLFLYSTEVFTTVAFPPFINL